MVKYIVKRILLALLVLFGVSVILYFLIRLMPTNIIEERFLTQASGGANITEADLQRVLALYGLDDNSFLGILKGYWGWLTGFLKGEMGTSLLYGQEVQDIIKSKMGISFGISFVSLILEVIIAIPLGIKCACNQYGKVDYAATVLCMIGMAFPSFFLGNLFIKWFAVDLGWFDIGGLHGSITAETSDAVVFFDMIWHLILPLLVMTILSIGSLMRYTRTNTLEVLNADYIRTARAKGLSENKVVYKHVFRNTLIPLVTVLASTLPTLFGGAMITEEVFAIDGIGRIAYKALQKGDVPLAMGYNMFLAVLTVLGTLLADIMYAVVDPRVKLGR